jgi:hypothetical protein
MPRKEFEAFTRLDASDVNTYLMDQAVMTFAGTAARGSAITSPVEGMLTYREDTNLYEYYNSNWQPLIAPTGITLVKSQTIGTSVTSVTVTSAFSTDYDAYKIIIAGGVNSENNRLLLLRLGAATTNYSQVLFGGSYASAAVTLGIAAAGFNYAGLANTGVIGMNLDLVNPFLVKQTFCTNFFLDTTNAAMVVGSHTTAASYTDFTISVNSGSMTGGTIYVYGYRKS